MKDIIDSLPFNLQNYENIHVTTDKLTATIRNKVFNYKERVESIKLDEEQSLNDLYLYNCKNSAFCDHGHNIS